MQYLTPVTWSVVPKRWLTVHRSDFESLDNPMGSYLGKQRHVLDCRTLAHAWQRDAAATSPHTVASTSAELYCRDPIPRDIQAITSGPAVHVGAAVAHRLRHKDTGTVRRAVLGSLRREAMPSTSRTGAMSRIRGAGRNGVAVGAATATTSDPTMEAANGGGNSQSVGR
ncbi:hypothetical protein VOLCADRAFT_104690 [Volvox carteri f. nagariensis]|uniref:Uncharacterized protein n=1 Tax=Volvox carteri f. nagariensis TaxID=3068 RepID=D8TV37_VOLCA|nr:uncharacterized protein VOLCADRAFT_104690 [Volvox carteri f. nagariensis]EFJ48634.1 hypothetical protein VOLCADRAFT_104690 [Volvox carteri f. nagariensis]|eukprot:XP_002950433.1 hypothetical protein VOLCADRAFT_104690 [Volvox carteri f. nagariensis]